MVSGKLSNSSGYGLSTITDDQQSQVLDEITKLEQVESSLYEQLQNVASSGGGTEEQQKIIDQIDKLSTTRIDLFSGLSDKYALLQDNVSQTRKDLANQLTTSNIVKSQLGGAKDNLMQLKTANNNNQRMTEINTYYGESYQAQTRTMILIIYVSIPIILVALLRKYGLLPTNIAAALILITLLIGGYFIITHLVDIKSRDNMVFSEYDFSDGKTSWDTDDDNSSSKDDSSITDKAKDEFDKVTSGLGCIDQDCCSDGTTYNSDTKKCEVTNITETFQSGNLPRSVAYVENPSSACPWKNIKQNIQPYSSNSNYATI